MIEKKKKKWNFENEMTSAKSTRFKNASTSSFKNILFLFISFTELYESFQQPQVSNTCIQKNHARLVSLSAKKKEEKKEPFDNHT